MSRWETVRTHHWSDWAGLACFTALAGLLWRRSPELGLAVLPALCYELLVAASFVLRYPPARSARGWLPRTVAYAHSFLPMVFLELAGRFRPEWLAPAGEPALQAAGIGLWLAGAVIGFWPLWHLRRAFSIEPEARMLVTSGPYRLARHPIYAMYLLINTGLWLRHPSLPFAVVLVVWFGLLLIRIRAEERVLSDAFPEYAAYRRRVGAFGPRLAGFLRADEA
ncbi:MAG: methyltransferase family protein [Gemmatimonadales bacterium]